MQIENPEIPEGINVSTTHPLKEFALLVGGMIVFILLLVTILSFMIERLVVFIPFSMEQQLADGFVDPDKDDDAKIRKYLEVMSSELASKMDLEEGMKVTVHYVNDDTVNAFATLGGHIFIHQGLIDILPNEDALAMVVAHEIGHIKHRHPVISMGKGVLIGLLLATLSGMDANRVVGDFANTAGSVALMKFSRGQEDIADRDGLAGLVSVYGHATGAVNLFEAFAQRESLGHVIPEFFSTHPLDQERLRTIRELARENNWKLAEPTRKLPDFSKDIESDPSVGI